MSTNNLNALNPNDFLKMMEKRERAIAQSDSAHVRLEDNANAIARQRHPQTQYLRVKNVRALSPTCKCYTLVPDAEKGTEKCAPFAAGQYLSVRVQIDGRTYSRPYSLCSSPKEALCGVYEIAVRAVPNGRVSEHILRTWTKGTEVTASAPMGNFVYEPLRDNENIVGIAVGSGITPFVSLAKAIADGTEKCALTLIYGCKNRSEMLFCETFEALRRENIRVHYVLREEQTAEHDFGYITTDVIRKQLPSGKATFFVCGPDSLYRRMQTALTDFATEKKDVRYETHRGESPIAANENVTLTVHTVGGVKTVYGSTAQTILEILEDGGVAPNSACRSGTCGFCRSRVLRGEYCLNRENDMRRAVDEEYGIIHPCCTYPKGDMEIEIAR